MIRVRVYESNWSEIKRSFSTATEDKMITILDAGLFDDLKDEVKNSKDGKAIAGIYTDQYSLQSPAYSDFTKDDLDRASKMLFRTIRKYYVLATKESF